MGRVTREILIARAPEAVFECLVDPVARARWVVGMEEEALPEGARLGPGSILNARRRASATGSRYTMTVTRHEPPRWLVLAIARNGKPAGSAEFTLEPAPGGSRVRSVTTYELPGVQRMMAPLVQGTLQKELDAELASLKRHAESRA